MIISTQILFFYSNNSLSVHGFSYPHSNCCLLIPDGQKFKTKFEEARNYGTKTENGSGERDDKESASEGKPRTLNTRQTFDWFEIVP